MAEVERLSHGDLVKIGGGVDEGRGAATGYCTIRSVRRGDAGQKDCDAGVISERIYTVCMCVCVKKRDRERAPVKSKPLLYAYFLGDVLLLGAAVRLFVRLALDSVVSAK